LKRVLIFSGLALLVVSVSLVSVAQRYYSPRAQSSGLGDDPPLTIDTTRLSVSPDGKTIGFKYRSLTAAVGGAGLFEWQTGKLTRVDFLPLFFSTDGAQIGALSDEGIALYDRASLERVRVVKAEPYVDARQIGSLFLPLAIQPGNEAVLCRLVGSNEGLAIVDLRAGTHRILVPPEDRTGFYSISWAGFVAPDEIVFTAMGPRDGVLRAALEDLGANVVASPMPYRLKFGELPRVAYQDIVRPYLALKQEKPPLLGEPPVVYGASRGGERVVAVGVPPEEFDRLRQDTKRRTAKLEQNSRRSGWAEILVIEQGAMRRVTHVDAYIGGAAISYDGSTVAFGVYAKPLSEFNYEPALRRPFDVSIVDLNTGVVTETNLIERIAADASFAK